MSSLFFWFVYFTLNAVSKVKAGYIVTNTKKAPSPFLTLVDSQTAYKMTSQPSILAEPHESYCSF